MEKIICCFFGHHDTSTEVRTKLKETVMSLITDEGSCNFLVGNHGNFGWITYSVLKELREQFPRISFNVVLAYMPGKKEEYEYIDPMDTLYPEGLEAVPKRFAISWRNDWMLNQSQIVVCYVRHSMGGSGKFVEKAERQGKRVINLAK